MTITINSQKTLAVLLVVLAGLYAANIFVTGKLTQAMVMDPVELSFILIPAPEGACEECVDPEEIVKVLDKGHTISYDTTVLELDSTLAKKYIEIYSIESLPAVIVGGDISNEVLRGAWNSFQGRVKEGRVIIENLTPYYELSSETVRGLVDVVLLTDKTCTECFDERSYLNILQRFGVRVAVVDSYDVASTEGSALVQTYGITKVPAVLASPEASLYKNLVNSWDQVGVVADDGWFVLREVQKISTEYTSL